MKRIFLIAVAILSVIGIINSSPITPTQAWQRVKESADVFTSTRAITGTAELKYTLKAADGETALYIFETQNTEGFVVVSADDATHPILGYTSTGSFNSQEMAPEFKYWLDEYARQIEYLRAQGVKSVSSRAGITLPEWQPIEPLVKTKWNQDTPYNQQCPKNSNGNLTVTGCVATSMSQAMKYHNYPPKGTGQHSYEWNNGKDNIVLTKNFSQITFDWDNMIDSYSGSYSTTQATAVSTLMAAAGYSVDMNYTDGNSGAFSGYITNALINYFGYDKGIRYLSRNNYQYTEWATMLYNNLLEYGPVIYDGSGEAGAHSFILDGYSGNGYFHFNWGWGGLSDGYYLLDLLNPASLGIGGGAGGFIIDQGAIFYMKPASAGSTSVAQTTLQLYGNLTGSASGNTLGYYIDEQTSSTPYVIYQGEQPITLTLGAKIENVSNPASTPQYIASSNFTHEFESGNGYYIRSTNPISIDISNANIKNGNQYKITGVFRLPNGNWEELTAQSEFSNYFYLTRSGTANAPLYNVTSEKVKLFSATGLEITTPIYENSPIEFEATIINSTDIELSETVTLALLDNDYNLAFIGENYLITLAPGESFKNSWVTNLTNQNGTSLKTATSYNVGLVDYDTGLLYYLDNEKVTVQPGSAETPTYTGKVSVPGAQLQNGIYMIDDPSNFEIVTEVSVYSGYFALPVEWLIYYLEPGTTNLYYAFAGSYNVQMINPGATSSFSASVNFPDATTTDTYYINAAVIKDKKMDVLALWNTPYKFKKASSSVRSLEVASGINFLVDRMGRQVTVISEDHPISSVSVYNVSGAALPAQISYSHGGAQIDLSSCGTGMVIINVVDKNGKQKSAKVAF